MWGGGGFSHYFGPSESTGTKIKKKSKKFRGRESILKIRLFVKKRSFSTVVPKLSVVALRNKNQSLCLDEYSRMTVYFLTVVKYLT